MKKFVRFTISSLAFLNLLQKKKLLGYQHFQKLQCFAKLALDTKTRFLSPRNRPIRLLCAISGGQDSILSFFVLFHSISQNWCWAQQSCFWERDRISPLEVVYCQHFWQSKNFFCSEFLFRLSFQVEVKYTLILPKNHLVSENRSREWRKKNFSRFLQVQKLSTLVIGHTGSDAVEKNLTNLIRGTSPKSLIKPIVFNSKKKTNMFFCVLLYEPRFSKAQRLFKKTNFDNNFLVETPKTQKNLALPIKKTASGFNKVGQKNFFSTISYQLHRSQKINHNRFTFFSSQNRISKKNFKKTVFVFNQPLSSSFSFFSKAFKTQLIYLKPLENRDRLTVSKIRNLYKFPISSDMTNFSTNFSRNKIRHQLIPFIRFLFQNKFESLLAKFFFLVNQEHQQIETKLLELIVVFKIIRGKSFKKKKSFNFLQNHLQKMSEDTLTSKMEITFQGSLLQNAIYTYREIEVNFLQISELKNFV